uniref:Apolipophorin-III n=1 Tax=Nicrophorus orbicollis TaxID=64902 RepID=A0A2L0NFV1_NICOR|nr:apolipophorin-III [Nicrophorus orbicollis]
MNKLFFVAVALFAIQGCMAKPKGAAPQKDQLEELAQNAQNLAHKIGEQLGIADLDTKKIGASLNEGTNKLLENLQSFLDKVKDESKAHEGEVSTAVKNVQAKLATVAADLQKAAGPDATKKAEEIKTEFNKAYKAATDQVQLLVKSYEPQVQGAQENFQKFSKTFLDNIVEIGQNVEKQVKTAVEEHEKTHSH